MFRRRPVELSEQSGSGRGRSNPKNDPREKVFKNNNVKREKTNGDDNNDTTNNNREKDGGGTDSVKRRHKQQHSPPFRYVNGSHGGYFVLPTRQTGISSSSKGCCSVGREEMREGEEGDDRRLERVAHGNVFVGGRVEESELRRQKRPRPESESEEEEEGGRFVGCHAATRPRPPPTLLGGWKTPRSVKKIKAKWVGLKKTIEWKMAGGL